MRSPGRPARSSSPPTTAWGTRFLHLADLGSQWAGSTNLALQDQMAALRWVRDNIASFGGDPGNITVAGQSAGAFSIGALLAAPAAAGLFHKAILQSGSTSRIFDRATATTMAEDLITALRLDGPEDLLTVTCQRILDAQSTVVTGDIGQRNLPGGRSRGAVLDGSVLPVAPQQAVADGAAADIPLLVSTTRDEVRVFQMIGGDSFRPEDETALYTEMRRAGVTEPEKLLDAYRNRIADSGDLSALRGAFLTDAPTGSRPRVWPGPRQGREAAPTTTSSSTNRADRPWAPSTAPTCSTSSTVRPSSAPTPPNTSPPATPSSAPGPPSPPPAPRADRPMPRKPRATPGPSAAPRPKPTA
uniref:carboxylesterase family protein n=1 Tax=Streptomyces sp. DG1A-41 TaxID=3125779 RepID=UPI00403FF02D